MVFIEGSLTDFAPMSTDEKSFNILIAEDNDVTRELMAGILRTKGYQIFGATDADDAIAVMQQNPIDMAYVDINMHPRGGFEFMKYLLVKGNKLPVVLITADKSNDILIESHNLGVKRVLQKPIVPERLLETTERVLRQAGHNLSTLGSEERKTKFTPEELMQKAIDIAARNASDKKGGPFGAVIADAEGKIAGEGVSGRTARVDPIAHAEVMAIRKAAEILDTADLSDYTLYCSSQPTEIGQALIKSVGIRTVYYGVSHDEISDIKPLTRPAEPNYIQMSHDAALALFRR